MASPRKRKPRVASRDELVLQIDEIGARDSRTPSPVITDEIVTRDGEIKPAPPRHDPISPPPTSTPFGRWLLQQTKREGWIGILAAGANADRGFPKDGDPEAVRKRLRDTQAEGDMFEAVDDAELEWLSF